MHVATPPRVAPGPSIPGASRLSCDVRRWDEVKAAHATGVARVFSAVRDLPTVAPRPPQLARSASVGSTRDARRAGIHVARTAAPRSIAVITA